MSDDVVVDPGVRMREVKHRARRILSAMGGAAILAAACPSVLAQCAMCRAAIGNSAEAAAATNGMNLAVLVLLIPPVGLFCAFFIVAYRYRKAPGEASSSGQQAQQSVPRRSGLFEGKRGDARVGRIRGDHDGQAGIAEAT
jgi:hypothetical protein